MLASPAFASRTHRKSAGSHARTHKASLAAPVAHRSRGQQAIAPERVTEIQQALIREHYLTTEADGRWDATTQAAMQKYQADQGWQTKLGLGPDYSNAINAKTATFSDPPPISTIPAEQAQGFAQAARLNR
jgi:peptidoglycan hydrolase-like protein with peptidoglycan-binding domain